MSRFGSRPIKINDGVNVETKGSSFVASMGENKAELPIPADLTVKVADGTVVVERKTSTKEAKSLHGLTSRLIRNAINGVSAPFAKVLEFTGTGYRAAVNGSELVLNMGYSHEIRFNIPEELKVSVVKNSIVVSGINRQRVGEFAAKVREVRPPEVYKGKGIKYKDELIRRKAGKTAASK